MHLLVGHTKRVRENQTANGVSLERASISRKLVGAGLTLPSAPSVSASDRSYRYQNGPTRVQLASRISRLHIHRCEIAEASYLDLHAHFSKVVYGRPQTNVGRRLDPVGALDGSRRNGARPEALIGTPCHLVSLRLANLYRTSSCAFAYSHPRSGQRNARGAQRQNESSELMWPVWHIESGLFSVPHRLV
jgi:hypothetical protein